MLHIQPIISSLLRGKSGPILLLLQTILSIAIVANASFIINERLSLMARESGVAESEVLEFSIYNFDENMNAEVQNQHDLETLRALPGVVSATITNMVPISGSGWTSSFVIGNHEDTTTDTVNSATYLADEQLLPTFGLNIVEGRNFRKEEILEDNEQLPNLVIVSQAFAKATWGDGSAIGKVMYQGKSGEGPLEVIGVVEHLQGAWINASHLEYSVIANKKYISTNPTFVLRVDPASITELRETIPQSLHNDNPNRVIKDFTLISEHRTRSYKSHELMATALFMMIVFLLLISSLGLAGMVMFNIEKRTKQIGTRRALGARKRDIVAYFLVENYIISLAGGILGVLLAFQLGQYLMNLYDLPLLEPFYPLATFTVFLVITTLAVIVPTRTAIKISPSIATRSI